MTMFQLNSCYLCFSPIKVRFYGVPIYMLYWSINDQVFRELFSMLLAMPHIRPSLTAFSNVLWEIRKSILIKYISALKSIKYNFCT